PAYKRELAQSFKLPRTREQIRDTRNQRGDRAQRGTPGFRVAQAGLRTKGTQMQNSEKIWRLVDARKDDYEALSDRVWGMPELCYGEYRSVAEHKAMLEQEG